MVVVTRRKTNAFAGAKVSEVVVNMDRLEEDVAPHARGIDIALAAFGVGKGSAKMAGEDVHKIEIAYPHAFCRAAKAGGARVGGVMTAVGADPKAGMKYAKIIGEKEKAVESVNLTSSVCTVPPSFSATPTRRASSATSCHCCTGPCRPVRLDPQERPRTRDGGAVGAGVPRDCAGQRSPRGDREDPRVQGDGTLLRQRRERRGMSTSCFFGLKRSDLRIVDKNSNAPFPGGLSHNQNRE